MTVVRVWRGWTSPQAADQFAERVRAHLPVLGETPGLLRMDLLRSDGPWETEFVTITQFATMDDVIAFAGEQYRRAVIPEMLQAVILRVEPDVRHYMVSASLPRCHE